MRTHLFVSYAIRFFTLVVLLGVFYAVAEIKAQVAVNGHVCTEAASYARDNNDLLQGPRRVRISW